jgi:exosortase
MTATSAPPQTAPAPESAPVAAQLAAWGWALALAAMWVWTWLHLSLAWRSFPNYEYGFAVPFLALYLARQRLAAQPDAVGAPGIGGWLLGLVAIGAWAAFLLGELLRSVDPVWRPSGILMALACTGLTAAWLVRLGGWRLLWGLAFPLAFTWTAVPWPTFAESWLTKGLKHFVTAVNVEILNATGVAAMQKGNVIDLVNGTVVVDGACSGVNSLQSSLMIALFLGELFHFTVVRRIVLLVLAVLIALVGNIARTFTLARLVHAIGEGAVETYHDTLGLIAIVAIYGAIIIVGWMMAGGGLPSRGGGWSTRGYVRAGARLSPLGAVVAALAICAVPALARVWFAVSPGGEVRKQFSALFFLRDHPVPPGWKVEPVKFTKTEHDALGFTEGEALRVTAPWGAEGTMYHFFWAPTATHATLFYEHTPDVCMPGAGWQLTAPPTVVKLRVAGTEVAARLFPFEREGAQTAAVQTIWHGGESAVIGKMDNTEARLSRLGLLWDGPRRHGMEVLSIFVAGRADEARYVREAEAMLAAFLETNPTPDVR